MKLLRLVLPFLSCVLLAACGHLSLKPAGAPVDSQPRKAAAEMAGGAERAEVQRLLAAGEYLQALQLIGRQLQKGATETDFIREYPRALNGLLSQARRCQEERQTGRAGSMFRQALEYYPADPLLSGQLDMEATQIEESLDGCSEALMEQGLFAYRDGRLGAAIDLWKKILTFSPSHQPAIKAIRTAQTQLENLKALGAAAQD